MTLFVKDTVIKKRYVKDWFNEYNDKGTHIEKTAVTTYRFLMIPFLKVCRPIDTNI